MIESHTKRGVQIFALVVIILFMNLPMVSALQISNMRAEEVTQTSAVIKWNTDEPADSFVSYGTDANVLQTIGDANAVVNHSLALTSLTSETDYQFSVESAGVVSDIASFTTLEPDTDAPEIDVELPARIKGAELNLEGTTEAGVQATLYVDGALAGSTTAIPITEGDASSLQGIFRFTFIILTPDQENAVKIEVRDAAGNSAVAEGIVFADTMRPTVDVKDIPEIAAENSIEIHANISEPATYEIILNGESGAEGEGQIIEEIVNLEEGENDIQLIIKDAAGWEVTKEFQVSSDTQPPHVQFNLEEGNEYYQGRADTTLHGETEAGADVFLYVYRPLGYEYTPAFDKAWAKTTADENGEFSFEVDFEDEPALELLKGLKPKLVPQGLQEYSIFSTQQVAEQQQFTYYVFVIAEDKSGKTGFLQQTVNVNTCFSGNFDFDVQSVAYLQAPMRLDPRLLDEGRGTITATFNMSYRGNGQAQIDYATGQEIKPAYEISNVQFEKACTQGMQDDPSFQLACQILPAAPKIKIPSTFKTAWFVSYNLHSAAELSEKKEDFWNEFKKRKIVFPLKVRISYRERDTTGNYGPMKTQASCIDLGYFVDIPIDSKDMLPDFIAEEGLDAITTTIEKIDAVMPYLEKAILVTGVGCISSFLGRMTARWVRITTSKLETYFSTVNPDKSKKCPANQHEFYLKSTIEQWEKIKGTVWVGQPDAQLLPADWDKKAEDGTYIKALDDRCPKTASMWKFEAALDQAYRWTCDRVFCRAVPAGWTASADKNEVDLVIQKQNQCTVSSRGIPLQEVENCQELITKQVSYTPSPLAAEKIKQGSFPCYRYNNKLYVVTSQQKALQAGEMVTLQLVHDFGLTLQQGAEYIGQSSNLLAYRPPNSEQFIVGTDMSCEQACKNRRRPGYAAAKDGDLTSFYDTYGKIQQTTSANGCYLEKDAGGGQTELMRKLNSTQFSAGYTQDCFVDLDTAGNPQNRAEGTGLLQCVCQVSKEAGSNIAGARTAAKATDKAAEDWVYHEERKYIETGKRSGTYYPEWRYYSGRDFSSAFGQDYALDYLHSAKKDKTVDKVNPHTQHIGTFQTMCLSGIRARLILLRSILDGLRGCIQEAKITGLHDAGMCKTLFSQHVCGLIYKSIAYFFTQCSPYSISDEIKTGALGNVGAVVEAGFGAIPQAMSTSIDDIKSDYGNAKLNQFFATGAQGFAQSICMAAFGYDWPMGMDFILDAAYAFPTKTTVHVLPAERELSTFNPTRGTAVYNYEVGAAILPGCRVKSYDVYLKCVGPEDQGHPGIQCGTQGCDCLRATETSAAEGEKIKYLDGGRGFDLPSGQLFSPPIPAPQVVDASYRYDHVVVELKLDPFENPDQCFDDGYKDGKFYFPIIDISPPAELVCQVQPLTGKYICPELISAFGGGSGAYLEDPYVSCFDKNTNTWARCDTPNLFTKDDTIKLRAHVQTDGELYCLQYKVSGLGPDPLPELARPLPQNLPGSFTPEINLGSVGPQLFSGTVNTLVRSPESDPSCSAPGNIDSYPTGRITPKSYSFVFNKDATTGKYRVSAPVGVRIDPKETQYKIDSSNKITDAAGNDLLTGEQLQSIPFVLDDFIVRGLIGSPQGTAGKTSCVYSSQAASGAGLTQNQKSVSVTVQLYHPDAGGSCYNPTVLVKPPVFGKAQHTENIVLQLESVQSLVASRMHQEFLNNNCAYVQQNAKTTIDQKQNDFANAQALYYSIACYIKDGGTQWATQFRTEITSLLRIFFLREYIYGAVKGTDYPDNVRNTAEYQKIETYLCCVAEKIGQKNNYPQCAAKDSCLTGTAGGSGTVTAAASGTTCAYPQTIAAFASKKPLNWQEYNCRAPTGAELLADGQLRKDGNAQCWARGEYSDQNLATTYGLQFGCPNAADYCCPPK